VEPKRIVLMGLTAIECVTGEKVSLSEVHGRIHRRHGRQEVLTYHPTAAMRFPPIERRFREDLAALLRI
jgi:DNA polymerase